MKKIICFIILIFFISCAKKEKEVVMFTTTFGNALHSGISFTFDCKDRLLILKRLGLRKVSETPPPKENEYSVKQKDSLKKEEEKYLQNYAKPKTVAYKLTDEEAKKLIELINSIPKEDRKDSIPKYPMGDGFAYDFQIIYSNGEIDDIEVQHLNIISSEKVIYQMLAYAKKYEKDNHNILVLKNFEEWSHPKY
ncbi:MAG: hypothetical protein E2590_07260 [Chryseobacterium sp.]|nr:hypothetical protein [Chryseobacterium sp.]